MGSISKWHGFLDHLNTWSCFQRAPLAADSLTKVFWRPFHPERPFADQRSASWPGLKSKRTVLVDAPIASWLNYIKPTPLDLSTPARAGLYLQTEHTKGNDFPHDTLGLNQYSKQCQHRIIKLQQTSGLFHCGVVKWLNIVADACS